MLGPDLRPGHAPGHWEGIPTFDQVAVGALNIAVVADHALILIEDERVANSIDLGISPTTVALAPRQRASR